MQNPFPTFNQAHSRLLLQELNQDARDHADGSTTLSIGSGSGCSSSGNDRSCDHGKVPMEHSGGSSPPDYGCVGSGGRGRGRGRVGAGTAHLPTPSGKPRGWATSRLGGALSASPACTVGAS
ncbi:hypothetical protein D1007_34212 [Hordeum vulgare]|nr:hypothetical protein D1007_34212 [Hordeum vulgare]